MKALDLYDYSATADAAALSRAVRDQNCTPATNAEGWIASQFKGVGIGFRRAIATDDVLARAINTELKHRGIYAGPNRAHVVLISEWDTFYGRTLPETFARCLTTDSVSTNESCDEISTDGAINQKTGSWLSRYSYLRGLDGQAADASAGSQGDRRATSDSTASSSSSAAGQNAKGRLLSENAQGEGQGDYLQRLAAELRSKDAQLRNDGGQGIRAVGILGSDLYDKLLVFQAVKSALPHALFFTTDLDGRLIRPAQAVSTVNLLVASGLGLSLRRHLQQEVPPFRGSYQTAAFLATLMAACPQSSIPAPGNTTSGCGDEQTASEWVKSAQLYEIGRTRAIPLDTGARDPPGRSLRDACAEVSGPPNVYACGSITTESRSRPLSSSRVVGLALLEAVAALAIVAFLLRFGMGRPLPLGVWLAVLLLAASVAALQLFDRGLLARIDMTQLLQGVSLWPSIGIQLVNIAFGIAAIFNVRRCSNANLARLRERLCMIDMLRDLEDRRGARSFRLRDALPFGVRSWQASASDAAASHEPKEATEDSADAATRYWVRYIDYARHRLQFARVCALALLGIGMAAIISLAFPSPVPAVGSTSRILYMAVAVLENLATLAVAFYVADITLFSRLFVREAFSSEGGAPVWPHSAKEEFARSHLRTTLQRGDNAQDKLVTTTMTITYVSERTKCITPFIYFPFIMIALSMISRSPVLGPSTFDPSVIMIEALSLLVAVVSAVALRRAAEDARSETLRQLNMLKWRALVPGSTADLRDRLEMLLERVSALREGAFSPLSQQPVVRALLLPLASYGSTLLLSSLSNGG